MCRNLKPLYNLDPRATEEEIYNAPIQFVRKISGFNKPSKANQEIFDKSVTKIMGVVDEMIDSLITKAQPKNREVEAEKVRKNFEKRLEKLRNG